MTNLEAIYVASQTKEKIEKHGQKGIGNNSEFDELQKNFSCILGYTREIDRYSKFDEKLVIAKNHVSLTSIKMHLSINKYILNRLSMHNNQNYKFEDNNMYMDDHSTNNAISFAKNMLDHIINRVKIDKETIGKKSIKNLSYENIYLCDDNNKVSYCHGRQNENFVNIIKYHFVTINVEKENDISGIYHKKSRVESSVTVTTPNFNAPGRVHIGMQFMSEKFGRITLQLSGRIEAMKIVIRPSKKDVFERMAAEGDALLDFLRGRGLDVCELAIRGAHGTRWFRN